MFGTLALLVEEQGKIWSDREILRNAGNNLPLVVRRQWPLVLLFGSRLGIAFL